MSLINKLNIENLQDRGIINMIVIRNSIYIEFENGKTITIETEPGSHFEIYDNEKKEDGNLIALNQLYTSCT